MNNFVFGYPDPYERVQQTVLIPDNGKVFVIAAQSPCLAIIESILIFDPVIFKDQLTEYLYSRQDVYFFHKN